MPILSPLPASLPPDTDPGRRIASLIKNHEVVSTYTQGLGWTKPKRRSYGHAKRLALSKVLWRLLRAVNTEGKAWPDRREGIRIRSDGFVNAQDVLAHPLLAEVNFMDIEDVVRKDSQKRFTVKFEVHGRDGGFSGWWIRGNAKESHASTQEVENELHLERVSSTERMSVAVHATTEEAWSSIVKHGISRMSNRYIHFFPGFTGRDNKVLNEHSCRVLVHIDLEKALSGGIKFYLASNGIILSPGNELGFLEQKYFRRVEKVAKTVSTLSEWNRGSNVGLGTHSQTEMMN
ncbi:hypothetical protein D9757_007477 [Collybiopsis confluens]|uniref:2'-phosphotransferase n=1 Tax=Collybiopsis confluens TaxID=2823264 RepID=A0A8H5HJV8_9AGAR|nr:hypothetical protein D9757_007477 [Collybiopsis confluens]